MGSKIVLPPDMQEFVNRLRETNYGIKKEVDKTPHDRIKDLEREVRSLKERIKSNRHTFYQESNRVKEFLRMLTTIKGRDLKRAVCLVIYWDKFSWIDASIVEQMRQADWRVKVFFDLPRNIGITKCMRACVGTPAFTSALVTFGYGKKNAEHRTRPDVYPTHEDEAKRSRERRAAKKNGGAK